MEKVYIIEVTDYNESITYIDSIWSLEPLANERVLDIKQSSTNDKNLLVYVTEYDVNTKL